MNIKRLLCGMRPLVSTIAIIGILALPLIGQADATSSITKKLNDNAALSAGESIFMQTCASCHGKDLSGASGFNLKDGEWVHGDKPEEILNNIKTGFANAGMPGFNGIYTEEQLHKLVAFILSKRESYADLEYKIFHLTDQHSGSFDFIKQLSPAKTGKIHNNIANFRLPEVKQYGIEFTGTFYTPSNEDTVLLTYGPDSLQFDVEIDGQAIPLDRKEVGGKHVWKLKPGKQTLTLRLATFGKERWFKGDAEVYVAEPNLEVKLIAVSSRAHKKFRDTKFDLLANEKIQVQRKRMVKVPAFSIAVGFPEKINYAFNTLSCTIEGIWQGDFLNIGPNVNGRGTDGSLPLGEWAFHSPDYIGLIKPTHDKPACVFEKYNRNGLPSFYFKQEGKHYKVHAEAKDNTSLTLHYEVLSTIKRRNFLSRLFRPNGNKIKLQLPQLAPNNINISSGKIKNNTWLVNLENTTTFSVTLTLKEQK